MLCIRWDQKGVLYYGFPPENYKFNSKNYCSQLNQPKAALDKKRPELVNRKCIIFHLDYARPHVSLTRSKNGYSLAEVLTHPLYSTDTAPLNVHLFQSLQNSLMENIHFPGKASVRRRGIKKRDLERHCSVSLLAYQMVLPIFSHSHQGRKSEWERIAT